MLYEIYCNTGSRYNGIPLYIYLTYTLCIMAVILQTRCFQMDNCEPDLSFSKYVELDCFRWLYIWSYLLFSFQVCSTQGVYYFTKWTAWGLAPNEDNRTPGTGLKLRWIIKTPGLKRLEHLNLNLNTVNWWILTGRDDVTKRRSSGASHFT